MGHEETAETIDAARRARWARTVLANVTREYPHKPGYVIDGPDDLSEPHVLHPAFYGSFDWHSAVHSHWALIRLLRGGLPTELAEEVRAALAGHLTAANLESERSFLAANPLFERPYGWAWVLALATEISAWEEAEDIVPLDAIGRLARTVRTHLVEHLRTTRYPVRSGTHGCTAFAMVLGHDHSEVFGDVELRATIEERAAAWFKGDGPAPIELEPSGEDFLSPTLTHAHLMARVLDPDGLVAWVDRVIPMLRTTAEVPLATLPEVGDRTDPKLVHLHGLALSRAWSWRAVADALPDDDARAPRIRDAASRLVSAALPHVVTGEYGGDHWLVSFALLADDDQLLRRPS